MKTQEEDQLFERAITILERGGCSGATLDFLQDLVWFGWDAEDSQRDYQVSRMRQLSQLYVF